MMMLTLEETYKAVLLKNMFDEELEIWNEKKEEFLLKGIVRNNTILRIALLTMGISAVIFFLLNSIVRPMRELIIWYPLFFFMGGCVALVVMLFFRAYNAVKKQVNVLKGKYDRDFVNCTEFMKVTEENYETVEKALKERCAIPKEFQRKDALEAMIVFIKQGRARDVKHAMWIIRNEFPYMLQ